MTLDQALDKLESGEAHEYSHDLAVCPLMNMETLIQRIYAEHNEQLKKRYKDGWQDGISNYLNEQIQRITDER